MPLSRDSPGEVRLISCLLEASIDGLLAFDRECRYTAWNSAMERISGFAREEVLGRVAFEVFPFLRETGEDRFFHEALAGRSVVAEARRYAIPETSLCGFFDAYYLPLRNEGGAVDGGLAVIRDTTARHEAVGALRASEERYRAFIANSSEAIWRCELERPVPTDIPEDDQIELFYRDGYLAECNDALARMYGFSHAEDLIGARIGDLLVREDPKNEEYLRAFVRSGYRLTDAESVETDKDGAIRFFLNNLVGVIEDGRMLRAWGTQRDLTERRRAEREREDLLKRERSARTEAERANRHKDEFLATLSHELRTPVTAILGWAHMLRSDDLDAAVRVHALEVIERNAQSQSKLIEDILDVSRIVTGKLRMGLRPVELLPIIEAAREAVQPAARTRGVRIEPLYDAPNIVVLGDASRLQQVVWNLLSNAVKFTPAGGRVSIRLTRDGAMAEISVSDTGEGIPPDFLPHVFDRFRQADMGLARHHGGLGLGLAIVRSLVERHGGSVMVESPGKGLGSTFTIQLPVKDDHAAAKPVAVFTAMPSTAEPATAQPATLAGIRLLIVDDEPDTLELLKMMLDRRGATVITAGSAKEALETLEKIKPDVLISDVGMPELDGFEFMRRVRSLDAQGIGRVPAIALTAYAGDEDRKRALEAGFWEHVPKPVDPARLINVIADLASGP
jgi:PAS domain S-box-containing protein